MLNVKCPFDRHLWSGAFTARELAWMAFWVVVYVVIAALILL
jgi:hypothetical protein